MSLNTLLEAAHFIELSKDTDPKAREAQATEFHHYAKPAPSPGSQGKSLRRLEPKPEGDGKLRPYDGSSLREVHNKLEKNRRAHLKECFDNLWNQIPHGDLGKTSNLNILRCALRFIQLIKRQDKELEKELHDLAQAKIASQQRIQKLQAELSALSIQVDLSKFMASERDEQSVSTVTAADESPIMSEDEMEDMIPAVKIKEEASIKVTETQASPSKWEVKTMAARKQIPSFIADVTQPDKNNIQPMTTTITVAEVRGTPQMHIVTQPPAKQHVSKILQQAIAERQKQQQKLADQRTQHFRQPAPPQQLIQNQQLTSLMAQPQVVSMESLRPMMAVKQPIANLRPGLALNQLLPSIVPTASLLTQSSSQQPTTVINSNAFAAASTHVTSIASRATQLVSAASLSNGQVLTANVGGVKHVITPISALPAAQILSPAHLSAITQLMGQQQAAQRPASSLTSSSSSVSLSTPSSSQLVSPLAVLSPTATSALGATQVLRIPMGNIPFIPQYTMPMKPVVMVTMPKVVTAASQPIAAIAKTSNS